MTTLENKIRGALFGVAVGDALGAPLEFMDARDIRHKYGIVKDMIGGGWLNVKPGEITDDTQMTMAVAKGIVTCKVEPEPFVGAGFIEWLKTNPNDVGNTCRKAIDGVIQAIKRNPSIQSFEHVVPYKIWESSAKQVDISNQKKQKRIGNGALMRTVYPGLFYGDIDEATRIADRIGRMTHFDNLSAEACRIYTAMIFYSIRFRMFSKGDLWDIIEKEVLEGTKYKYGDTPIITSSGYVVDTMQCALYCIRHTGNFHDALVVAANLGGDADTIAAVTGGLAGAIYGYDNIPNRWSKELHPNVARELDFYAEKAIENHNARS